MSSKRRAERTADKASDKSDAFWASLPARWRPGRPKPAILKKPIECSWPGLDTVRGRGERLQAVFGYYGVDWKAYRQTPASIKRLIELMASDLFPLAFKIKLLEVSRTKKRTWTASKRVHLLEFMRDCEDRDMTQEAAAQRYIDQGHFPGRNSAKGIVAEYNRAEAWERAGSPPEEQELVDELERWAELEADIKRGK
jgi:hypothetical protein